MKKITAIVLFISFAFLYRAHAAGNGISVTPLQDSVFTKVETEATYPGGVDAWRTHLMQTLSYPKEALKKKIQGTVTVEFIVDANGKLSDIQATEGPEELRAEAVRVIKKSGKWTPAKQGGRAVKAYRKQPIVFRLETK